MSMPSSASGATPTKWMSGSRERSVVRPARTISWSSTTTTRTVFIRSPFPVDTALDDDTARLGVAHSQLTAGSGEPLLHGTDAEVAVGRPEGVAVPEAHAVVAHGEHHVVAAVRQLHGG